MKTPTQSLDYSQGQVPDPGLSGVDLDQRRYEIARDVSRMMIACDGLFGELAVSDVARKAVRFADALIAELQRSTAGDNEDTDKEPGT